VKLTVAPCNGYPKSFTVAYNGSFALFAGFPGFVVFFAVSVMLEVVDTNGSACALNLPVYISVGAVVVQFRLDAGFAANPQYNAFRYNVPARNWPSVVVCVMFAMQIIVPPGKMNEGLHKYCVVFAPFMFAYNTGFAIG
jgi:hypothetical protein